MAVSDPGYGLTVAASVLQFLDFAESLLDDGSNSGQLYNADQDSREIELRLKEDASSHDVASDQISLRSDPEVKQTQAEVGIQKSYEKSVVFADKFSSTLQKVGFSNIAGANSSSRIDIKARSELEKLRKEAESLRTDTARQILLLLSKPYYVLIVLDPFVFNHQR